MPGENQDKLSKDFNRIRLILQKNRLDLLKEARRDYSEEEWRALILFHNKPYNDLMLVHYAGKFAVSAAMVMELKRGVDIDDWFSTLKKRYLKTLCSPLHFCVVNSAYDAAVSIKKNFYPENKKYWYQLLHIEKKCDGYTPLHYAGSYRELSFIKLFQEGCSQSQWASLVGRRTKFGRDTPIDLACSNESDPKKLSEILEAFRSGMSLDQWCQLTSLYADYFHFTNSVVVMLINNRFISSKDNNATHLEACFDLLLEGRTQQQAKELIAPADDIREFMQKPLQSALAKLSNPSIASQVNSGMMIFKPPGPVEDPDKFVSSSPHC